MLKKISAAAAAVACFAAVTAMASAQNTIGRAARSVVDAGENIINGAVDAGENAVNGIMNGGRTGSDSTSGTDSGTGDSASSGTSDTAGSDTSGDTANSGTSGGNTSEDISDVTDNTDSSDISVEINQGSAAGNPVTGISFGFTAAAAVLGALGVVVTANRRGE